MNRLDSTESDLDLDIDLESGGTSEEDAIKVNGDDRGVMSESSRSIDVRNWLSSFDSISSCEGNSANDTNFRREMVNIASKTTMDKGNPKKQKSTRPPKPPRPPNGPTLNPSDMKLLKEISELNLQRKKMERMRTLRKIKKEKASTPSSNIFAFLVTVIFFLVIIFQGLLGSRM